MKIAIASKEDSQDSEISDVSGRAPFYMIYEDGNFEKKIKNPFSIGGGGAGFGVAKMLKNENVDIVAAGKFGGNIISALEEKNIKHLEISGIKVSEALKRCQDHSEQEE